MGSSNGWRFDAIEGVITASLSKNSGSSVADTAWQFGGMEASAGVFLSDVVGRPLFGMGGGA